MIKILLGFIIGVCTVIFYPDALSYVIDSGHHDLLKTLVANNHTISTWRVVPPTLIELLCAATGLDRETIGMDVEQSSMIPFRTIGGEEE